MANEHPHPHPGLRKFTLLAVSALTIMSGATISPSLPDMAHVFADSEHVDVLVKLVLTMPAIFIAVLAPFAGWIVDRFGRKRLMLFSVILYAVGGGSGLVLDSLATILVGRAVLGLAVAGSMTTATTLIGDYYSGDEREGLVGYQAAFMGLGGVIFLVLGGILADLHWRAPFAIYLLSLVIVPLVVTSIYEPDRTTRPNRRQPPRPDVTFRPGLAVLIYALTFIGMAIFYMVPVQLPFFLEANFGATGTTVGLAIASLTFIASGMSLAFGKLRHHLSFIALTIVVQLSMAVGYTIMSQASELWIVFAATVTTGLGMGLMMPTYNLWMLSIAPQQMRGRLVSGVTASVFAGQFVSPILTAPLIERTDIAQTFGYAGYLLLGIGGLFVVWLLARRLSPRSN